MQDLFQFEVIQQVLLQDILIFIVLCLAEPSTKWFNVCCENLAKRRPCNILLSVGWPYNLFFSSRMKQRICDTYLTVHLVVFGSFNTLSFHAYSESSATKAPKEYADPWVSGDTKCTDLNIFLFTHYPFNFHLYAGLYP